MLKKIQGVSSLLSLFVIVLSLCCAANASAQSRGSMTMGLGGGYATYNKGGYAGAFFMYSFSRHVRIVPEVGYVFRNEGKSGFIVDVDMHFPASLARGVNVYPLVGVSFNNWTYEGGGNSARAGMDFGGGFDINLTSLLKLTLQGKYTWMKDVGGGYIGLGIGYNF